MKKIKSFLLERDYRTLFLLAVAASAVIWLLASLISWGKLFTSVFFLNTGDLFADFFNSIRDAAQGIGAYTDRKVIYPPMANLIFMLLSYLSPDAYNNTAFDDRYTWKSYGENIALISVFVLLCTLLFGLVIALAVKGGKGRKLFVALAAVVSVPFLNVLERGNIMSLALIALLVYAFTYRSEKSWVRELGLVALAFSVSLKLYPALFAWILIGDKRYKEFFRCVLYSILLLVLPSFAFGGPSIFLTILGNILSFSSGDTGALGAISRYAHLPEIVVTGISYGWFLIASVCFLLSPFLQKERWKIWMSGCIMFLCYPPLTSTYGWALLLIPMVMMFNEEMKGRKYLLCMIAMIAPFLFFPINLPIQPTVNSFVIYLGLAILSVYQLFDTVRLLRHRGKE